MNFTITRCAQISDLKMDEISTLFTSGFEHLFRCFKKDCQDLAGAFTSAFHANNILAAHENGEILGILGYSDRSGRAMKLCKKDMQKHLGLLSGTLIYHTLAGELQKPFDHQDTVCYIDFLITRPEARGKGIGQALLRQCLQSEGYNTYQLQVDTANIPACSLYEKNGFTAIKKEKNKYVKQTGVCEWALMECSCPMRGERN